MMFDIDNLNFINYLFNPLIILSSIFIINFSIIVFYIIFAKCDYKQSEILLIFILNIIHAICGIKSLLFAILKLVYGYMILEGGTVPCFISALFTITYTRIEPISIGYIAFMRYSIVCHSFKRGIRFWITLYFLVIVLAFSLYLYPLIAFDVNPINSMLVCAVYIKPKPETYALYAVNPFVMVIPCCISTYSYFMIGIKAFKKLNQMKKEALSTNDDEIVDIIKKQKHSLILQLILVFIVFNVLYMPVYITIVLRFAIGYKRTPFTDAVFIYLMEISRMVDPIITINFQPELNHEFQVILTKLKVKFKSIFRTLFNR